MLLYLRSASLPSRLRSLHLCWHVRRCLDIRRLHDEVEGRWLFLSEPFQAMKGNMAAQEKEEAASSAYDDETHAA